MTPRLAFVALFATLCVAAFAAHETEFLPNTNTSYLSQKNYIAELDGFSTYSNSFLIGDFLSYSNPNLPTVDLPLGEYYAPNFYIQGMDEVNGYYWISVIDKAFSSDRQISLMLVDGALNTIAQYSYLPSSYESKVFSLPVAATSMVNVIAQTQNGLNLVQIHNGEATELSLINEKYSFSNTIALANGQYATLIDSESSGYLYAQYTSVNELEAIYQIPSGYTDLKLVSGVQNEPLLVGRYNGDVTVTTVLVTQGNLQLGRYEFPLQAVSNEAIELVKCGSTLTLIGSNYMLNFGNFFDPLWAKNLYPFGAGATSFTSSACQNNEALILNYNMSDKGNYLFKFDLDGNFQFGAYGSALHIADAGVTHFSYTQDTTLIAPLEASLLLKTSSISVPKADTMSKLTYTPANGNMLYADDL